MKKVMTFALALMLTTASSHALAASAKCKVTAVDNGSVTMECGKKADSFKVGDEVKIKAAKKKAIEGC